MSVDSLTTFNKIASKIEANGTPILLHPPKIMTQLSSEDGAWDLFCETTPSKDGKAESITIGHISYGTLYPVATVKKINNEDELSFETPSEGAAQLKHIARDLRL